MKYFILLLVLCFAVYAQARTYYVWYRTKAGRWYNISNENGVRTCYCVKNINTHIFDNIERGDVKIFRSTDCTGTYQALKGQVKNTEWVHMAALEHTIFKKKNEFKVRTVTLAF
ncbi:unnamed protein product [Cunninghamella echinulata]